MKANFYWTPASCCLSLCPLCLAYGSGYRATEGFSMAELGPKSNHSGSVTVLHFSALIVTVKDHLVKQSHKLTITSQLLGREGLEMSKVVLLRELESIRNTMEDRSFSSKKCFDYLLRSLQHTKACCFLNLSVLS